MSTRTHSHATRPGALPADVARPRAASCLASVPCPPPSAPVSRPPGSDGDAERSVPIGLGPHAPPVLPASAEPVHDAAKPRRDVSNLYGYRELAELCEAVIMALFACPPLSPLSSGGVARPRASSHPSSSPRLVEFIAYALHRTRLPTLVTYQALYLLKRLKQRFPSSRGSSGHRLFISALMLSSKALCDDTYSNKSWAIVGQGLFSLEDINTMEHELFSFLGYRVNVPAEQLLCFADLLEQGYLDQGLYIPPRPPSASAAPTSSSYYAAAAMKSTPSAAGETMSSGIDAVPLSRSSRSYSSPFHAATRGASTSLAAYVHPHVQAQAQVGAHVPAHAHGAMSTSFSHHAVQAGQPSFPKLGPVGPPIHSSASTSPRTHALPLRPSCAPVHAPAQVLVPGPLAHPEASLGPALEQLDCVVSALPSPSPIASTPTYWPCLRASNGTRGCGSIDSVSAGSVAGELHPTRSRASSSGSTSHGGGGYVRTPSSDGIGHDWLLRAKGAAHLLPIGLVPRIDGPVAL